MTRRDTPGGRPSPWRRRVVIGLVAVLAVVGGGVSFALWRLNANISKVDVSAALGTDRPTDAPTDAVNLLLIGSDTRDGEGNDDIGRVTEEPGNHSDTNLLRAPAADRSWATVVSIPRDSMTLAPPDCSPSAPDEDWVVRQWNQNYAMGAPAASSAPSRATPASSSTTTPSSTSAGSTTWSTPSAESTCAPPSPSTTRTPGFNSPPDAHARRQEALQYVRARKSVGDGSDLGRIGRQQAFLSSVMQEATSTQLILQPSRLYSFLDAATSSLTTDPEFGVGRCGTSRRASGASGSTRSLRHGPARALRPRPQPRAVARLGRRGVVGPA